MAPFSIRKATILDYDAIWHIIQSVISSGETYVFSPYSGKEKMLDYWCAKDAHIYVAIDQRDTVAGTYVIRDNRPDLGSHVANGSYMVAPAFEGKGIGRLMGCLLYTSLIIHTISFIASMEIRVLLLIFLSNWAVSPGFC